MTRRVAPWQVYLFCGLLATAGYFALPSANAQTVAYDVIGLSGIIALLVGIRLHRPASPWPWLLLMLGDALSVAGDVIWTYDQTVRGIATPFPSLADALYLGGLAVFCVGVVVLLRGVAIRDRAAAIDTAILATGAGLIVWTFLIDQHMRDTGRPLLDRLVSSAYPLLDILLLAVAVRLILGLTGRTPALRLLIVSLFLAFATDLAYAVLLAQGHYQTGHLVDAGWLLVYVLHGVVALHPSMRDRPVADTEPSADLPSGRVGLLAAAALMGPALLALQAVRGEHSDVPVIVGSSAVLFLLVLWRLRLLAGLVHRREARFRALVQHASDGVAIVNANGVTIYQSPAVAGILGFGPDELLGGDIFARIHPDDEATARHLFADLVGHPGSSRYCDLRVRHADGSWRVLDVQGTNLLDEPAVGGIVVNYRDSTERKRAEQLLAGQASVLERIAHHAPLPETLTLLARQIEGMGDGALVSIHMLEEDGATLRCIAAPSLPAAFVAALESLPIGEGFGACGTAAFRGVPVITSDIAADPLWADYRDLTLAQGLRACWSIPILARGEASANSEGRLLGTFAVYYATPCRPGEAEWRAIERSVGLAATAIERERATTALRHGAESLASLFEASGDGLMIHDNGQILVANQAYAAMAGYAVEEVIGRNAFELLAPEWRTPSEVRSRTGDSSPYEAVVVRGDGTTVPVELAGRPIRYQGRPARLVNMRDISARKAAEAALRDEERRFRELYAASDRQARELALLDRVHTALARELDPAAVFRAIVEAIASIFGHTRVSLYLREGDELVRQQVAGQPSRLVRLSVASGIMGRVARTGRPVLLEDVSSDPDFIGVVEGIVSEVCVPLLDEGVVVGVLNLESTDGVRLGGADLWLMTALSEQVGIAIGRARLYAEARRQARDLALLDRVRTALAREVDPVAIHRTVVEATAATFGYARVVLCQVVGDELVLEHMVGYDHVLDRMIRRMPVARGVMGRVARTGEPALVVDVAADPDYVDVGDGTTSEICVPIPDAGRVVGVLNIETTGDVRLGEADLQLMIALGEHVGLATGRARLYTEARTNAENLATAQQIAHVGSWEYDIAANVLHWSDEVFRIGGFAPQAFVPTPERMMAAVHPDDRELVCSALAASIEREERYDLDHRIVRPDGVVRVVHQQAEIIRDAANRPLKRVGIVQDVTERRMLEAELQHRAFHDSLTGLPNRALFLDRLGRVLARAGRSGRSCAVLFFDLDKFKEVNDTLGHDAGDRLLVAVAERLRVGLRGVDTLARLGGDEFAALLDEVAEAGEAAEVAGRLAQLLGEPLLVDGQVYRVAASIGIVLSTPEHARPDDLLRDADIAMYRAKADGGAGYALFDPTMQAQLLARLALERDLEGALERGEFCLHFQPIVDLDTGRMAEVEALVRWQHPERGLVPPDTFIPVAEEMGVILPLGRWVLGQACQQARRWHDRGHALVVSVNLSAREFQQRDLVASIAAILGDADLAPEYLRLEITERLAMRDAPATAATLAALRRLGVQVAIDDFGTGYSSLAYLKRFPVDVLKIDRVFVAGLDTNAEDVAIVRAMVSLARTLGLAVTAEGVETAAQAAQLRALGATHAQGYFFSRPLDPAAIVALLELDLLAELPAPLAWPQPRTSGALRRLSATRGFRSN